MKNNIRFGKTKFTLILLLLYFPALNSFSQNFSISAEGMNTVYIGVDNPMTIILENTPCSDLIIKPSRGKITGDSCTYTLRLNDDDTPGEMAISIFVIQDQSLVEVGKKKFRVKNIPSPEAAVGGFGGGQIIDAQLKPQECIILNYEGFDFECPLRVVSFSMSIIRGDTCLYSDIKNKGFRFSKEVTDALKTINPGDTVIFKNIICDEKSEPAKHLAPIVFYVTN